MRVNNTSAATARRAGSSSLPLVCLLLLSLLASMLSPAVSATQQVQLAAAVQPVLADEGGAPGGPSGPGTNNTSVTA